MTNDEVKKLKQEIMGLSIELAKQQDEIDELKKYKQLYLLSAGKYEMLKSKLLEICKTY